MKADLSPAEEIYLIDSEIERENERSQATSKRYREMTERKRELERQMRLDHSDSVWMEQPKAFRDLFTADEDDSSYKIGDYGEGLVVTYRPVGYDNKREEVIFMHVNKDRLREGYETIGGILATIESEDSNDEELPVQGG